MQQYLYNVFLFNTGLILAVIAGISRYQKIDMKYRPFIWYLLLSFLNEAISLGSSIWFKTTVVNNNIFMLAEMLLLNRQFENWVENPLLKKYTRVASAILACVCIAEWAVNGIAVPLFYFNVGYSFYLVMFATHRLAWLSINDERRVYKNPAFIICAGMVFYFCMRIIVEAFWFYGLHKSPFFRNEVYVILMSVNLFVNLLYLYAILWIQKKPDYITFYG